MSSEHIAASCDSSDPRPVSLAHLSDPHLPPPQIPWSAFWLNKRLLSLILWATQRRHVHQPEINQALLADIQHCADLSALLVSGDITNFGTREEYLAAITWLQKLPFPAIAIPGNHDAMVAARPCDSLDLWKPWTGEGYPFIRYVGHVAIIGLNSAIPTPPFTAYGRLDRQQMAKLEVILDELGKEGYCRVIMIHHPPKAGLLPPRKSFLESHNFADILRRKGAEIVLHGHSHKATVTTIDGTDIPLVGVGGASLKSDYPDKEASWNHLRFTPHDGQWTIDLTRRNYKGQTMETRQWSSPAGKCS